MGLKGQFLEVRMPLCVNHGDSSDVSCCVMLISDHIIEIHNRYDSILWPCLETRRLLGTCLFL